MSNILVAEDSFALANLLEFVLTNAGFEVTICRTGGAARDAAASKNFDLISLDQQMPTMTGIEVLESVREGGPNVNTPVFLCTAKTHELDLDYLKDTLRIAGIFHKPFSPKELVAELTAVLNPLNAL